MNLAAKKCVACEGGIPHLSGSEAKKLLKQLPPGWIMAKNSQGIVQLEKTFKFKNFVQAMEFVNKTAAIAEKEGHHPNIYIFGWNRVRIELYTHAIRGLHENDFIIAAKTEKIRVKS